MYLAEDKVQVGGKVPGDMPTGKVRVHQRATITHVGRHYRVLGVRGLAHVVLHGAEQRLEGFDRVGGQHPERLKLNGQGQHLDQKLGCHLLVIDIIVKEPQGPELYPRGVGLLGLAPPVDDGPRDKEAEDQDIHRDDGHGVIRVRHEGG